MVVDGLLFDCGETTKNSINQIYSDFEQDLILACKCHYGDNGIKKVIADHVGYIEPSKIKLDSIYHFISELYIKMVENNHLKAECLLKDRLSPRHIYDQKNFGFNNKKDYTLYDIPRIICDHMIGEIQMVQVKDSEKNLIIIDLHEPNLKFKK